MCCERDPKRLPFQCGLLLVEILLEAGEEVAYFFGPAEVGDGVGNRVAVPELEERRQFFTIEFLFAFSDVMGEDEIQEGLLLKWEVMASLAGAARSSRVSGGRA
jgi:hypothetical protein